MSRSRRRGTNKDSQTHNRTLFADGLDRHPIQVRLVGPSEWNLERCQCANPVYRAGIEGRRLSWGGGRGGNGGGRLHGWELGHGIGKPRSREEGRAKVATVYIS